ncbi:MAG: hypothetical protein DHS20C15_28530 [Planctomycetota bacterium]|nr:MAG: hypothetical protein DHS20C15_28530 [Planctomycetota bacterium]
MAIALIFAACVWFMTERSVSDGEIVPLEDADVAADVGGAVPAPSGASPMPLERAVELAEVAANAAANDAPPTGPLAIRVEHAHGVPATGARVGLYTPEPLRYVAEGVLDERGAWSHAGFDGTGVLFVVGVTPRAVRFDLDIARGEHVFTLPEGAVISGRVLVDGAAPTAPFPLAFSQGSDQRWGDSLRFSEFFGADRALEPVAMRGALTSVAGDSNTRGFYTDASGAFVISALTPGTDTWLWGPWGWQLNRSSSSPMPTSAPATDLLLEFTGPESLICGRVIDASGVPQADLPVRVTEIYESRRWVRDDAAAPWRVVSEANPDPRYEVRTDASGRFCLLMHNYGDTGFAPSPELDPAAATDRFGLEVVAARSDGLRAREHFEGLELSRSHDLGDLVLRESEQYLVRVIDELDQPVAGALVSIDHHNDGDLSLIERTDANGLARVDNFDVDFGTLTIVARDYDTARVFLADEQPGVPIVVRVQPAVVLTMKVTWPEGFQNTRGWTWRFEVWGAKPLFQDALLPEGAGHGYERYGAMSHLRFGWAGKDGLDMNSGNPEDFMMGYSSHTDSMIIEGLRPGNALRPEFFLHEAPESFGELAEFVRWVGEPMTLQPGEHRTIHVDMSALEPKQ